MLDPAFALRQSAIVTRLTHAHLVRLHGADATRVAARLITAQVRVRDGQLQHTLLLNDDGTTLADAYLLRDDDVLDLLYEGPDPAELLAHIARNTRSEWELRVEDCAKTRVRIGLDGPYAWELLSRLFGAEVVGLPYLTFAHFGDIVCLRGGKTGEYGYELIVPATRAAEVEAQLHDVGEAMDATPGSLAVLDQASLESFFFNIRWEGAAGLTPLELQLQWRLDWNGHAVGLDALRVHRARGATRRVTTLLSPAAVAAGDAISLGDDVVGQVLNAGYSRCRSEWVALGLLDRSVAMPGIRRFIARTSEGDVEQRSVSPPLLNNASLFVNPQMHAWTIRHEVPLPPLVRS